MRSLGRPFDAINEEALILRIYDYASLVDGYSPSAENINIQAGENVQFEVDLLTPENHQLDVEWFVDGQLINSGETLSSSLLTGGSQTLTVVVSDNTRKVIVDEASKLVFEHSWQVDRTVESSQAPRVENNTIYLPYLRIQADLRLYSVELAITSTDPYRFTVTAAELLDSALQPDRESSFDNDLLSITDLVVGNISYGVTLRLIESEPEVVFELESATVN